jgi:hypothetical protein
LGCDSVKGLERYFWGVAQAYGKKPIKSVAAIETTLKQKFKLCSDESWPSADSVADSVPVPSKAATFPLHTSRTRSGMSAIYNFGELGHKLGPEWRWHQKASPSNPNPVDFLLKPQMRGRHIFGATSAHPGKCFEWKVVRDKDNCGAPKFVISEFVLDKSGFRSQQTKISAPSPRLLWNNVFVDLLGLSAPNHGADLCGFHDTSLARLLIFEKRRFVKRCTSCDRKFLRELPWFVHSAVCQAKGGKVTKAMQETAALRDIHFKSLEGCAVEIKCSSDFPIPQDDGYAVFETMEECMLSWEPKFLVMESSRYADVVNGALPPAGWATKENCRRPSPRHPADVVAVLRQCFDASPRMNNYQVHQRLKRDFKLGSKVLRINQISGWITSEIKRRKNAAMAAVADAANMVEEALQKGVSAKLDGVFEAHTDRVLSANDFEAAVAIGMNPEVNLEKWKHSWRWDLFPARRQEQPQRLAAEEEQRQEAAEKQLRKVQKEERKRQRETESTSNGNPTNKRQTGQGKGSVAKEQQKGSVKSGKSACKKSVKSTGKKQGEAGSTAKEPDATATSVVDAHVLLLLPGQAWSNCCGAPVAEIDLDKGKNCKDQSDGSECSKRRKELGKRKRKPATR